QRCGLLAGPLVAFLVFFLLPQTYTDANGSSVPFENPARVVLVTMIWMAIWWMTEATEVSTTALLPLVVLPFTGAVPIKAAAAPYAHHLIFLYMGGFIIALSMQRWGLDKRMALGAIRLVGTRPVNMVGGFMIATAFLSAFISNTATTAMMLPIGLSVVALLQDKNGGTDPDPGRNLGVCLMLAIAYAATLGGVSTLIGTPPNGFFRSFVEDTISEPYRMEVGFDQWLLVGLPVSLTLLPITWLLLTRIIFPVSSRPIEGGNDLIRKEWRSLGRLKRGEWNTLIVFILAGFFWITRRLWTGLEIPSGGGAPSQPFAGLNDSGVAMAGAVLLFLLPAGRDANGVKRSTMDWATASKMPWEILILFGGGLSLAAAVDSTGVARFIGSQAVHFAGFPTFAIVLIVTLTVILLTELTSNLATTAALLPVLAALAPGLGIHPYLLIFPATLAASCAFMMPVATPPNAIVFGSGHVTLPQMMKAGIWLNLLSLLVVLTVSYLLLEWAIGVAL
ncbi:MAG: SLC13 family permease, partial [Verrucomicrobiota bacterium]